MHLATLIPSKILYDIPPTPPFQIYHVSHSEKLAYYTAHSNFSSTIIRWRIAVLDVPAHARNEQSTTRRERMIWSSAIVRQETLAAVEVARRVVHRERKLAESSPTVPRARSTLIDFDAELAAL